MLRSSLFAFLAMLALVPAATTAPAQDLLRGGDVSRTNRWTLNDLVRDLPPISPSRDRELRRLSALQEGLYLHEQRMRGEGLPPALQQTFQANYKTVVEAVVADRLPLAEGLEYLSVHRQLLQRTHRWLQSKVRDERFAGEVVANLDYFARELCDRSLCPSQVPESLRTPLLNGYQIWLAELVAWGKESGHLSPGASGRIEVAARRLELFERQCKADGQLTRRERELLHGRLVDLARETMRVATR
jgi:hypothetical protein